MAQQSCKYFTGNLLLIFSLLFSCTSCTEKVQEAEKLNVLMIAVDDLRPELGSYGNQLIQTPNMDRLAQEGMVFKNAYCNIPVCGASRASLLTGTRPTKYRYLNYNERADQKYPAAIPISQHFKDNGYRTISNGKIFHVQQDHAQSWDENWRAQKDGTGFRNYLRPENKALETPDGQRGPAFEAIDVPDSAYFDGQLALKAIQDIKNLKNSGDPFFLSVGFVKPHLPFNAPQKYWDLYDRTDFSPTEKENWPANAPKQAFHKFGELRSYHGIPKQGPVDDSLSVTLQHGYYAATSYADHLIGMVLDALDESGLRENTVVILWGDHGWNLGEHGLWCKHCNFNTSLQAPLIISAPGFQKKKTANTLVEFVDIYPTLAALCGLPIPNTVEGKSLVPVLKDSEVAHKDFIVSQFQKGITLKTQKYAYTEWRDPEDQLLSNMLFDHQNDPDETDNLAGKPQHKALVDSLSQLLIANRGEGYFVDTAVEE